MRARDVMEAAKAASEESRMLLRIMREERKHPSTSPAAERRDVFIRNRMDALGETIAGALDLLEELGEVAPPEVVDACELRYLEGLSWREVGERVGYSDKHVFALVVWALSELDAAQAKATREMEADTEPIA